MATSPLQSSGMLSREQLLYLFNSFSQLTSQPDVKKRIADAVNDKQEAVAATTTIQESIFLEMGVDPSFGISCLGKVNVVYENDQDLMIRFYKFVAKDNTNGDYEIKLVDNSIALDNKLNWLRVRDSVLLISCKHKFRTYEEMACDEAELGPDEFAEKMHYQQQLQEQQLEMLKHMRKFHMDDQSAILEKLHQQMENANFEGEASVLSPEQIQETVRRRVSPLFQPR
ncbi:hypothetical protein POTOM_002541 [Populus tomentosa]|uniref:Uncharacterized protein n=1 Tax=Populus tomentosa TaxID=118781 RepID=A0A8X8DJW6_POPTO|nr:hypothetical protein POTOM_002541 [Populus tomentosa]